MIISNINDIPKSPGIYLIHTPNTNKPPYVGSSMNLWKRFNVSSEYKYCECVKNNRPILNSLRKYGGLYNCKIEIFHWWDFKVNKEEVLALETAVIDKYNSLIKMGGYNICLFGNNTFGFKHSQESKQKMSDNIKKLYKNGYVHPQLGTHLSEEHKNKLKQFHIGKKHTPKSLQKMSMAQTGENNGMFGKIHSVKSRSLISQNHAIVTGYKNPRFDNKLYKFINLFTNDIFYGNRYDFYVSFNLDPSHVAKLIKKKIKTYRGWKLFS